MLLPLSSVLVQHSPSLHISSSSQSSFSNPWIGRAVEASKCTWWVSPPPICCLKWLFQLASRMDRCWIYYSMEMYSKQHSTKKVTFNICSVCACAFVHPEVSITNLETKWSNKLWMTELLSDCTSPPKINLENLPIRIRIEFIAWPFRTKNRLHLLNSECIFVANVAE